MHFISLLKFNPSRFHRPFIRWYEIDTNLSILVLIVILYVMRR